ncbi:MEDS domain-containing protein [Actinacidiphila acididurans]|uniref:MEDS domain-containing protein n=1 Tax=Actinacidiphila acididurans TaxID=2784346 RepID=A0ABS2TLV3_9ACTN|nr:MEDS domain-containing protein [Actinacidiphila acididurans]MBM9504319.1 MEDS domain-containing protein [Actinacidiphila acididurans]
MRIARSAANLAPADVGDHVCWVVPPQEDFHRAARAYLSDGAELGDKIMVVGSPASVWHEFQAPVGLLVDPFAEGPGRGWDADALVALVRQEAETADRQGFRALRVLAQMDRIWASDISPQQVADQELRLDALIGGTQALVVCAYPGLGFLPGILSQAASVHPHFAGTRTAMPPFQMFSSGEDCWSVAGVVDADGATAFFTAVTELLPGTVALRLRCDALELMDVAGMRALARAAGTYPGRKILVENANTTVRRCWELLGYDDPGVPVELVP